MTYYGTTGLYVLSKHFFHLLLDQEYQLDQGNLEDLVYPEITKL